MNEEKELPFFKKMIISIKNFEKYPELASKKWSIVIAYLIKLLILFTIVISFCSVYKIKGDIGQAISYVKTDLPNFTFQNNTLKMDTDNPIILEYEDKIFNLIIIDTNEQLEENINNYKQKILNTQNGIIILNDKIIIKTTATKNTMVEYSYPTITENYQIQSFNKQDLLKFFTGTNLIMLYIGFFIITFIYMLIAYFISIWLDILLLAVFGYITALFMRLRLRFSAMCKIAIHSLTLPILLNAVVTLIYTFTGFELTYFQIMYVGIACIYIVTAILMIKSDVIKNQQELAKIIEEQAKVKEEMEKEKQEQEREKQEEKGKKKEENKKKKEDEEEQEQDGLENGAQGENA